MSHDYTRILYKIQHKAPIIFFFLLGISNDIILVAYEGAPCFTAYIAQETDILA